MTLWDAMFSILLFLSAPVAVAFYGIAMLVGTVSVWAWSADVGYLRWWWVFWIIPALFLGVSFIVWGCSSAEPSEWIPR